MPRLTSSQSATTITRTDHLVKVFSVALLALFCCQATTQIIQAAPSEALIERTDPAILLPAPHQLPAGYKYQSQPNEVVSTPLVRSIFHDYDRLCDDVSLRSTHLTVSAVVAINLGRAAAEFDQKVNALARNGWTVEAADGLIGDQAIAARRTPAGAADRSRDEVMIYFRSGYIAGGAAVQDDSVRANFEQALQIASVINGNIMALQADIDAEIARAKNGEGLPPLASSGTFRWPAWTVERPASASEPFESPAQNQDATQVSCGCEKVDR